MNDMQERFVADIRKNPRGGWDRLTPTSEGLKRRSRSFEDLTVVIEQFHDGPFVRWRGVRLEGPTFTKRLTGLEGFQTRAAAAINLIWS